MIISGVIDDNVVNFYNYLQTFHKNKKVEDLNTNVLKAFNAKDTLTKAIQDFKRIDKDLGPFMDELDSAVKKASSKESKFMYIPYDDIPTMKSFLRFRDYTETCGRTISLYYLMKFPDAKFLPYLQQTYDAHDGFYDWNMEVEKIEDLDAPYPYESWDEAKDTVKKYLELDDIFHAHLDDEII